MLRRRYSDPEDTNPNWEKLLDGPEPLLPDKPIPRVVHFVHTRDETPTWIEWMAVKAAFVHVGAKTVKIWAPVGLELDGAIWERILAMPGVVVERIVMPTKVYGHDLESMSERVSDVVRLKILYEEGGIYMDNDLVALRSSDDVLDNLSYYSVVMAERMNPLALPNWMIMARPWSPFIKSWMKLYQSDKFKLSELATDVAYSLSEEKDLKGQVKMLLGPTWFYPLGGNMSSDAALSKLWFGHTWYNIDSSYGTHVWHWDEGLTRAVTPEVVRNINTPLFCRLRSLFDELDGQQYTAEGFASNPECAKTTIAADLHLRNGRLFAKYEAARDRFDFRMEDLTGFNLHGWAVNHTTLKGTGSSKRRQISAYSFAVLPTPIGWDARVFTIKTKLRLTPGTQGGFLRIRTHQEDDVLIQFKYVPQVTPKGEKVGVVLNMTWADGPGTDAESSRQATWLSPDIGGLMFATSDDKGEGMEPLGTAVEEEKEEEEEEEDESSLIGEEGGNATSGGIDGESGEASEAGAAQNSTSTTSKSKKPKTKGKGKSKTNKLAPPPPEASSEATSDITSQKRAVLLPRLFGVKSPPELTITHDRRKAGKITVFLGKQLVGQGDVPLIHNEAAGQEIWLNAQGFDKFDTGLRGSLHSLSLYADAIAPDSFDASKHQQEQTIKPGDQAWDGTAHSTVQAPPVAPEVAVNGISRPPLLHAAHVARAHPPLMLFPLLMLALCVFFGMRRRSTLRNAVSDLREAGGVGVKFVAAKALSMLRQSREMGSTFPKVDMGEEMQSVGLLGKDRDGEPAEVLHVMHDDQKEEKI